MSFTVLFFLPTIIGHSGGDFVERLNGPLISKAAVYCKLLLAGISFVGDH